MDDLKALLDAFSPCNLSCLHCFETFFGPSREEIPGKKENGAGEKVKQVN